MIQSGIDQTEDTVKKKAQVVERSNMVSSLDDSVVSMATSGISVTTSLTESTNMERMQLEIDKLVRLKENCCLLTLNFNIFKH